MTTATLTAGEPELWDEKWKGIGTGPNAQLFTRGRPRTHHELIQQLYFIDLWLLTMNLPPDARYCELGAGRGTTSQYLSDRGANVTMVDLSDAGFKLARDNFNRSGTALPMFVRADVRDTGIMDGCFHCVYSIGLLEHFEDPRDVLREAYRLLAPGGILFQTILPGDEQGDVTRTNHDPFRYVRWCAELGQTATCERYRGTQVLLLTGTKS